MPCWRQSAAVAAPASCSCSTPRICSCANRLPRILSSLGHLPVEDSHYLWTSFRGQAMASQLLAPRGRRWSIAEPQEDRRSLYVSTGTVNSSWRPATRMPYDAGSTERGRTDVYGPVSGRDVYQRNRGPRRQRLPQLHLHGLCDRVPWHGHGVAERGDHQQLPMDV